ncbi:hypothetical protein LGN06_20490 [Burkholderia vietnamiensis]|uniref:hypothetical protein n=1 Tax=Burkholderia vietnamiensis TaxID=60552 RepID=UPI001CF59A50|nr:hypothetical protein [Burkholderia vietnamiensis]MCA8393935.1 hypothetical protein [Burkholderia vietnamiensis]
MFLDYFAQLSIALRRELTLADVGREAMDGYLVFLRDSGVSTVTQKNRYTNAKSVLKSLCERKLIYEVMAGDSATFPRNPFPGVNHGQRGERPLPKAQRQAFTAAVKTAVMPLFSDSTPPTSELLAYALLIIALHTGRNTWPLLEMTRDCLHAHPKDDRLFLVLYKRRSHSTIKVPVRSDGVSDLGIHSMPTVRPGVARLIRRVLELSDRLRDEAPPNLRSRVWLYRMRTPGRGVGAIGNISTLTSATLERSIKLLVERFNLVDTDGAPLHINVSRLRKTFVNRIYEILDGDIVSTASAAGDSVAITDVNYLRPGERAEKNWKFMGVALVTELLAETLGATERTPLGRCSDPEHGDHAPKRDGATCMNFLNCLRCRNYAVTGDDLYRLFSFYWCILGERMRIPPKRWKREFAHIIRLIDRDVIEAGLSKGIFKKTVVDSERERARHCPHPFWQSASIISDLAGAV